MQGLSTSLRAFFTTERYISLVERDRAITVYQFNIVLLISLVALLVGTLVAPNRDELLGVISSGPVLSGGLALFVLSLLASIQLTRRGRLELGALILVLIWAGTIGLANSLNGLYSPFAGQVIIITIMLTTLLLGTPGLLLGTALAIFLVVLGVAVRDSIPVQPVAPPVTVVITSGFAVLIAAAIVYRFLRSLSLSRQEGVNESLQARLTLAEITAQITQRISSRAALTEVLRNAVDDMVNNYPDIYHAQIFLVEGMGLRARLAASTGEVGQQLLERGHSLDVGSRSVIGAVTAEGRHVVARAAAETTIHRRNEYLPDTLVEAAFPLRIGDRVIGALDLQSRLPDAFPEQDLSTFQTLADHLAIAIDNARLFEETERRLVENRDLLEQNQRALREVERYTARLTGAAWTEFLEVHPQAASLSLDLEHSTVEAEGGWLPGMEDAVTSGDVVQQRDNGHLNVAMPVRVRGTTIGALAFEVPGAESLIPEDLALIEKVSERLGLALENARLYDESQRAAQRQALINQISTRLQASNNVEATLREAASSLQATLGAGRVAIRLGPPPQTGDRKDGGA